MTIAEQLRYEGMKQGIEQGVQQTKEALARKFVNRK